jgi:Flp pilus assembly protein TadG
MGRGERDEGVVVMADRMRHRAERGQATVEFALVLPIVLLVVVGGIQFGLAFNFWLDLNHVASEGARWASVNRLPATATLPSGSSSVTANEVQKYVESQVLSKGLLDSIGDADEAQSVTLTAATGGTFALSFKGQVTSPPLAWDSSANVVQTALEALSTIGPGNVTVGGPDGGPYTVTFVGTLGNTDVEMLVADASGLTGPGATADVAQVTIGNDGVVACYEKSPGNTLTAPQAGDALSITIKAPYKLGFGFFPFAPLTLKGRSTMRIEQVPSGFAATDACP